MKTSSYLAFIILILCKIVSGQSTIITPGNNQSSINSTSVNAGIEIPKITLTNSLLAANPITSPVEGMLIYNIGSNQTHGFYLWSGTSWTYLGIVIPSLSAISPLTIQSNSVKLNTGTARNQLISWDNTNWVNTNPKASTINVNIQPYLALNYCISLYGVFPQQNSGNPYVGDIELFAFNFAPVGWAFCNGQLLSIAENDALFALIGTTYGGDGQTTFGLPDLRGRVTIHKGQGSGLSSYVIGQQSGTETNIINDKY